MGRLVVLILLIVAAVWLVRRALRSSLKNEPPRKAVSEGDLVACAHCGMYLPRSEARQAQGGLYCSDEHARLGKR